MDYGVNFCHGTTFAPCSKRRLRNSTSLRMAHIKFPTDLLFMNFIPILRIAVQCAGQWKCFESSTGFFDAAVHVSLWYFSPGIRSGNASTRTKFNFSPLYPYLVSTSDGREQDFRSISGYEFDVAVEWHSSSAVLDDHEMIIFS